MVVKRHLKMIFFRTGELVSRFTQLYLCFTMEPPSKQAYYRRWVDSYYGEKCYDMYAVTMRATNKEMDEISKAVGLKKVRWNGKVCWVYVE